MDEARTSRLSRWMRKFLGAGAGIIAAAGILLGVWEYKQRGDLAQARETMAMIDIWDQRGARTAYRALSRGLETLIETDVSAADKQAALTNRLAYRNLRANVSRSVLARPEQQQNFEDVVYYFTRLSLCIEAGLCDAHVAKVFFGDTLDSFLAAFLPGVSEREHLIPGFGQPLRDLQRSFLRVSD